MNKIIFNSEEVDYITHLFNCKKKDFAQTIKALLMNDIDSRYYPEFRILKLFDNRIKQHIVNEYLRTHNMAEIALAKTNADVLGNSNLQGTRATYS